MILTIFMTSDYPECMGAGLHHGSPGVKSYVRTVINHLTSSSPDLNVTALIAIQ